MAHFAQVLDEIGDFGRFQVQIMILACVPTFLSAFQVFGNMFMVLDEAHHCSAAWVQNHTFNWSAAEQLALSVPVDAEGRPESCLMFRPPPDNASLEDILSHRFNETQSCETGWDYPEHKPQSLMNEVRFWLQSGCPLVLGLMVPLPDPLCLCHQPLSHLSLSLSL